jgi:hypothetical protein
VSPSLQSSKLQQSTTHPSGSQNPAPGNDHELHLNNDAEPSRDTRGTDADVEGADAYSKSSDLLNATQDGSVTVKETGETSQDHKTRVDHGTEGEKGNSDALPAEQISPQQSFATADAASNPNTEQTEVGQTWNNMTFESSDPVHLDPPKLSNAVSAREVTVPQVVHRPLAKQGSRSQATLPLVKKEACQPRTQTEKQKSWVNIVTGQSPVDQNTSTKDNSNYHPDQLAEARMFSSQINTGKLRQNDRAVAWPRRAAAKKHAKAAATSAAKPEVKPEVKPDVNVAAKGAEKVATKEDSKATGSTKGLPPHLRKILRAKGPTPTPIPASTGKVQDDHSHIESNAGSRSLKSSVTPIDETNTKKSHDDAMDTQSP